jgi:hypothetical protein
MKRVKCPKCGKTTYLKTINGIDYGYYERAKRNPATTDKFGIPAYDRTVHNCYPIHKIPTSN